MCTLIRESENIAEARSPSCVYVGEFYLGRAQMKIWLKNKCHANQFMNLCSPKVNYLQACEQPPVIGYFFCIDQCAGKRSAGEFICINSFFLKITLLS